VIDNRELEEIFGIPQDGSNISEESHDSAYIDVCGSKNNNSFDDELLKLQKDMEQKNVKLSKNENACINDEAERKKQDEDYIDNLSGTQANILCISKSDDFLGDKILQHEDKKKMDDSGEKITNTSVFSSQKKKEKWKLENSDLIFEKFYAYKKEALSDWLLTGGNIDFNFINSQLIESRVDLSNINFADFSTLFDILKQIQKHKDNITQLEIACNNQYFCWKRAIELFQGVLAQCYYEKPAAKQDGVVYEHMNDFISYFTKLESLHHNIQSVIKNLDQAFDTVSRQITISMPSRDYESIENRTNKNIAISEEKIGTTKMDINKQTVRNSVDTIKTGTVDWNVFK